MNRVHKIVGWYWTITLRSVSWHWKLHQSKCTTLHPDQFLISIQFRGRLPLDAASIGLSQPHDPPEQVLVEIEKILADISSSSGHTIEAPISLCGRVINAVIWEEELWTLIYKEHIVHIGSFIRLRNVNNSKLLTGSCNCECMLNRSIRILKFHL